MSVSKQVISIMDYDGETSTVRFPSDPLTAGNIVAQQTAMAALRSALAAIITPGDGTNVGDETRIADYVEHAAVKPANAFSQREIKWLVRFHYATTLEKGSCEIPCADLTLLAANSEKADLTGVAMAAFVTAFEAFVTDGSDHHAIIDDILYVSRNL